MTNSNDIDPKFAIYSLKKRIYCVLFFYKKEKKHLAKRELLRKNENRIKGK